jgi:hypothetical protein
MEIEIFGGPISSINVWFVWLGTAELELGRMFDCCWFYGHWWPKDLVFSFK